jgi:hypothetical protein
MSNSTQIILPVATVKEYAKNAYQKYDNAFTQLKEERKTYVLNFIENKNKSIFRKYFPYKYTTYEEALLIYHSLISAFDMVDFCYPINLNNNKTLLEKSYYFCALPDGDYTVLLSKMDAEIIQFTKE